MEEIPSLPPCTTTKVERLRDSGVVNEYGLALLAPLLDFDDNIGFVTTINGNVHRTIDRCNDKIIASTSTTDLSSFKKSMAFISSSSSTTATTQSESTTTTICCDDDDESDDNHDDDINNDVDDDESDALLQQPQEGVHILPECSILLETCTPILTHRQMNTIQQYLPYSIRDYYWDRVYNMNIHGDSFHTVLQKCYGYKHSIMIVRTSEGHVLGGYASEEWQVYGNTNDIGNSVSQLQGNHRLSSSQRRRNSYYGTGESFIFGCNSGENTDRGSDDNDNNNTDSSLRIYPWTGNNDYCQICDIDKSIMCMGGEGSFGWILSDNFTIGQTGYCATYNNPPLISSSTFDIADFEIYVLISPMKQFMMTDGLT